MSRLRRLLVAVGIAGLMVSLLPTTSVNASDSALEWQPCPEGTATGPYAPLLQCATVSVPLDYEDPDGRQIEIAISRLASTNNAERRGVLLTNPGGPGGPGLSLPADLAALGMPVSVLDRYDIIGMDPRGIGRSTPFSCGFTTEQGINTNLPPYAENNADVAAQASVAQAIAEQCVAHDTAGTMRYLTTANTARDMDRIRIALSEEKISYFGVSYGTVLGSAYASLFPERTDRVVLDSNVGDTALDTDGFRRFGLGAEQRFPDFAKYAAARSGTYDIGRTPAEVRRNFFALVDRLNRTPVEGVDGSLFRLQMFGTLYSDQTFPQMAQLWQALDRADAPAVRRVLNEHKLADPSPIDNILSAQLAVVCNDSEWPRDVTTYQRNTTQDRRTYPIFGGAAANILPCAFWPEPLEPKVEISDDGPSNILLVQNLRDPATPHLGGVLLRLKFGDRARLVSIDQGGHGAYLFDDNPCGLNTTTKFLADGKRPANDKFCAAAPQATQKAQDKGKRMVKTEPFPTVLFTSTAPL
jgi:pimeloyl-ACP methyl ester carboxylesterase